MVTCGLDKDLEDLIQRTQEFSCKENLETELINQLEAKCISKKIQVGKIISQCLMKKQAIRTIILTSWKAVDGLEVEDLGTTHFSLPFFTLW